MISLNSPEAVFIQSGQAATISSDGRLSAPAQLQQAASGPEPEQADSATGGGIGGRGTPWVLLGAAGGGAAIVAAIAAGSSGSSNPSPSAP